MENIANIQVIQNIVYIISSVMFILGIKMLGKEATAVKGNYLSALAMFSAVGITCLSLDIDIKIILAGVLLGGLIGSLIAIKVKMTAIPEMVALFNGFGGLATFLIAWSQFNEPSNSMFQHILIMLTIYIGGITFSGSLIAYGKLSEKLKLGKGSMITNIFISFFYLSMPALIYVGAEPYLSGFIPQIPSYFAIFLVLTLVAGIGFVMPIGGGDMPVVISLLNSLSGIAAAFAGLLLLNNVLIVAGSLVGASGLILTIIMAKAMNRTITNILFVGYASASQANSSEEQGEVKPITPDDAYLILENASSVLVVPGYGMAVAQAQHVVREMGELLEENGTEVKYGIHPVAGRMPGHMNVLLAEANVSYDLLAEPDDVNPSMDTIDVAIVIGANDVVNPSATEEEGSPIYGMPIIEVHNAKTVFVLKRSMSSGFAGVQNPLFFKENTRMLFGDAKALFHDVIVTLGMFSLFSLEINLSIIAAVLTIVGYSMNDTVVIFDRVRENLRKYSDIKIYELTNISINETLSRTLLTSITTLLALLAIYFFGGEILRGFSFAMILGVIFGTYSSIYIANTVLVRLNVTQKTVLREENKD